MVWIQPASCWFCRQDTHCVTPASIKVVWIQPALCWSCRQDTHCAIPTSTKSADPVAKIANFASFKSILHQKWVISVCIQVGLVIKIVNPASIKSILHCNSMSSVSIKSTLSSRSIDLNPASITVILSSRLCDDVASSLCCVKIVWLQWLSGLFCKIYRSEGYLILSLPASHLSSH